MAAQPATAAQPVTNSPPVVLLITGIQAAGKSTVAQLVAEQLEQSVHLRGDRFRRMIVSGRADMTPDASPEALSQLRLRYRLTASAADQYFRAGFTVVAQDIVLGQHLTEMVQWIRSRPLLLVVLAPEPAAVAEREARRAKNAYGDYTVASLDAALRRDTPRIGLWLDTTDQTPRQTAAEILRRAWTEAAV
jgi:adenylylsulfate kinase-like enzyme